MDWGDEIEYNGANAVNDWNYHIGHATQVKLIYIVTYLYYSSCLKILWEDL